MDEELENLKVEIFGKNSLPDIIRTIRDPEHPLSLEDLGVVTEDLINIKSKVL
jgi:hypothetical protein